MKRVTGLGGFFFKTEVKKNINYFKPSKKEGVTVVGKMEEYDYGKFGWILDSEGNKIELWEPIDKLFQ